MMRERLHEYEKYAQVPNVRYAKNAYGPWLLGDMWL